MKIRQELLDDQNEWLETDGLGGFASGTVTGLRTRRYHALLLAATSPPTGRYVLLNGFDAWVELDGTRTALSTQRYLPEVRSPDGADRIAAFTPDPWPTWNFRLEDGTEIVQEIFVPHGLTSVCVTWRLRGGRRGARLLVRPFLSGRDIHALHHENAGLRFEARVEDHTVVWHPYAGVPAVEVASNATYHHDPTWYRNFLYQEDRARGLDCAEDLASPGLFSWDLSRHDAVWIVSARMDPGAATVCGTPGSWLRRVRASERNRRQAFPSRLHKAADAYLVRRGNGRTIVAGYPWFSDWGRDTFVALRGLCLAAGRPEEARNILLTWAGQVSEGMLPNRFVEQGDCPEFNSVDAGLWYIIAVHDYRLAALGAGRRPTAGERRRLDEAVDAILSGYAKGTRHGIGMTDDGLLAAGEPGVQLTWMDAKVGDWVVTPRIGKPIEVQALWLNALAIGGGVSSGWRKRFELGRQSFARRFWHEEGGYLYDVVDVDHVDGQVDARFRPNQIFAVGGLPLALLDGARARQMVAAVEARLWTPLGLRSLAPEEAGYCPHYEGGVSERDGAYHQGTVWPWLLGPFVEAWVRVRGTASARREARRRFLSPILKHLDEAGIGHVSEIADGASPHQPRGCPFQAWSVGEVLRLAERVLR